MFAVIIMATEKGVDFMGYANVLISAYPNLGSVIKTENDNYLRRCLNSAYFNEPVETFTEKLLSMIAEKQKLIDLKCKLDVLFSRLTDEEKALILFKYTGKVPENKFCFSLRTYFRKQKRLQKKIETFLSYLNITEDVFEREYKNIRYFKILSEVSREKGRRKNEQRVLSVLAE